MSPDLLPAQIERAHADAGAVLNKRISPSTAAEYQRVAQRLVGTPLDDIASMRTPTRRVAVASIKRHIAGEIRRAKQDGDVESLRALTTQWCAFLARFPPPQTNALLAAFERQQRERKPGTAVRTRSKKALLAKLPRDWRERVLRRLASIKSPHAAAVAILDATGARPEELHRGVIVKQLPDGQIQCRLQLAKGRGRTDERTITVDPAQSVGAHVLARGLQRVGTGELHVQITSKMALCNALRRAGRHLFKRGDLTPYAYRHQFAADQKRSGTDRLQIAAAMGHSDDRMLSRYGAAMQGSTNRQIKAETTRQPKAEHARQFAQIRARAQDKGRKR